MERSQLWLCLRFFWGPSTQERKAFGKLDVSRCLSLSGKKVGLWLCEGHMLAPPWWHSTSATPRVAYETVCAVPGSNVCLPCPSDRLLKDSQHGLRLFKLYHAATLKTTAGLESHPTPLPLEDSTQYPGSPAREREPGSFNQCQFVTNYMENDGWQHDPHCSDQLGVTFSFSSLLSLLISSQHDSRSNMFPPSLVVLHDWGSFYPTFSIRWWLCFSIGLIIRNYMLLSMWTKYFICLYNTHFTKQFSSINIYCKALAWFKYGPCVALRGQPWVLVWPSPPSWLS